MENDAASVSENKLTDGSAGGKNLVSFQMRNAVKIFDHNPLVPPHQMVIDPATS